MIGLADLVTILGGCSFQILIVEAIDFFYNF
jgi:hypothetical protein